MTASISSINYCPVKSISFQTVSNCKIKKNIGIVGDRVFAFSKGLEFDQVQLFEKNLDERRGKWNKILTLKNSPVLNKYNFKLKDNKLTFTQKNNEILTIEKLEVLKRAAILAKGMEEPIKHMINNPEVHKHFSTEIKAINILNCLLYTSDAADE